MLTFLCCGSVLEECFYSFLRFPRSRYAFVMSSGFFGTHTFIFHPADDGEKAASTFSFLNAAFFAATFGRNFFGGL